MTSPLEKILLGTAVGDSLGLPAEGLSAARIAKRWSGPWRHRFLFSHGMVSDDTEHTAFVAQCLAEAPDDPAKFQRLLAWKLRWWLVCLPAGIGFATLRAILKLWLGFPPARSGVFSAGNGPAMRSAILGAYFADDPDRLREYVRVSTRLTHTDPKAEIAALAVAETAAWASRAPSLSSLSPSHRKEIEALLVGAGPANPEWAALVGRIFDALANGSTVAEFARALGLERGVSGYAWHSVPVALFAWLRHFGDFRTSLEMVLNCGGDTDTVGAITGALAGIHGPIPAEWVDGICDYPLSHAYLRRLAGALTEKSPPPFFPWLLLPLRNLFFLVIVLLHGFRRFLP